MNTASKHTTGVQDALAVYAEAISALQRDDRCIAAIAAMTGDIIDCIGQGGKVLLCGNGGFAAVCQHVAAELMGKIDAKRPPIAAISLATDMSVITCIANDFGYEQTFARQIEALGRPGDIVICLSASGRSKNILEAMSTAARLGIKCWLCGSRDTSLAAELKVSVIPMHSDSTDTLQDLTMMVLHKVCRMVEQAVSRQDDVWSQVIAAGRRDSLDTLIIDRDGTVNALLPNDYVLSPEQLKVDDDFLNHCSRLAETFSRIIIVTNQACIGKGIADAATIDGINRRLVSTIESHGGRIDRVYVCGDSDPNSPDRKPNTGMADRIKADFPDFDPAKAIVAGDAWSDELFARRIGAQFINIPNV